MFLLWLLLALSMVSMVVTTMGMVVRLLLLEFGLEAFIIGRNCWRVRGSDTLILAVTLLTCQPI